MTTTTSTETAEVVESRESKKDFVTALLKGGSSSNNPVTSNLLVYSGLATFPLLYKEDGRPTLAFFGGVGGRPVNGSPNLGGWMRKYGEDPGSADHFITADRQLVPVFALIDKDIAVEVNVSPLALELGMDVFKEAQLDGDTLHQQYGNTGALLIYKEGDEIKTGFIIKSGDTIVPPEDSTFILLSSCIASNDYQGIYYQNVVLDSATLLPVFALMEKDMGGVGAKSLALGQDALDSLQSPDTIERLAELWLGVNGYGL